VPHSPDKTSLHARPLTAAAFAPFGKVIEHGGVERRNMIERDFCQPSGDLQLAMWVSRLTEVCTFPLVINQLERHPHSHQAFIPLLGQPYLVVCCPDLADGSPDLTGVCAFVASAHQGVIYHRNVWHAGLQVLDAPAEFTVVMAMSGEQDDVLLDLATDVRIDCDPFWKGGAI
jgi:ureidoglycolate lyase